MLELLKHITEELESIPGDYLGEVVAAELLESGLPDDKIMFRTQSSFKRSVSRDIDGLAVDAEHELLDEILFIDLNREGIYDMLPEGIFHFSAGKKGMKNKSEVTDEIKLHRRQEAEARRFFTPVENEFFHQRLQLEQHERQLVQSYSPIKNRQLFYSLYGVAKELNDKQIYLLLFLLPLTNKIRGNCALMEFCLEKIFRLPVKVFYQKSKPATIPAESILAMGAATLGVDTILGNSFNDGVMEMIIEVNEIPKENISKFIHEGSNARILNFLLPYFVPVETEYKVELTIKKLTQQEAANKNSKGEKKEQEENISFLGFDSYI